jgi:uncharacterized protein YndB with AHSA1/START domain
MPKTSTFLYVTFIRTTPERLWDALTDPATIRTFWMGAKADSTFKTGAPWSLTLADGRLADTGEILESDPPTQDKAGRLVIKWRNEFREELKAEGWSVCAFDIEKADGAATKLTVTHTLEREGSKFIEAVSGGWPAILSNLKSLLETGELVLEGSH